MLLSDRDIRRRIEDGSLIIGTDDPVIRPASVLLHLGSEFVVPHGWLTVPVDPDNPPEETVVKLRSHLIIQPAQFVLAHTVEAVGFPADLAGQVDGRSSLARLGLQVHQTAGHVDPGFFGQITLELLNVSCRPIRLRVGMAIVKLGIIPLSSPAEKPYGHPDVESVYQGQGGVTPARMREPIQPMRHFHVVPTPVHPDKHEPPAYPAEGLEWEDFYANGGW
jgi:dCTP deaminase